jgi:hypothetical protein
VLVVSCAGGECAGGERACPALLQVPKADADNLQKKRKLIRPE